MLHHLKRVNNMELTKKAGAFALALMICEFVAAYLISALNISNMVLEMCLTYALSFGIPAFIFLKLTKSRIKETLYLNHVNIFNIILVILITISIQPCIYLLSGISALIFPNEISSALDKLSGYGTIPLMICLAVFPAVFEEICYRGIIFSGYGNVNIKKAAVLCGFIFAIAHLTAQQFLYSFAMGMVFCVFVYYTKSIYPSMLSHFILNALQVISLKASVGVEATEITVSMIAELGIFAISSLPILALLFFAFIKINTVHERILFVSNENILMHNPDKRFEEKAVTWPVIVLTVIYILIAIVAPMI